MIDRKIAPELNKFKEVPFLKPKVFKLSSTSNLYWMGSVPNSTSRIEFYFDAGSIRGKTSLASFTSALLFSGTKESTSVDIQKKLDSYGAYKDVSLSSEECVVTIYALNSMIISAALEVCKSIEENIFPSSELEELRSQKKQNLNISLEKVGVLCKRKFNQEIFAGTNYSDVTVQSDIERVSRDELIEFHKSHFLNGLKMITVVGDIDEGEIGQIIDKTKAWSIKKVPSYNKEFKSNPGLFNIQKDTALQSAIRVGKIMFNKSHPDFMDFFILNTVLGDYFGSRLMTNLREDKGFTYGVGSLVSELHASGIFIIGTEVGKEHKQSALDEIRAEITKISSQLIPEDELILVKNYLLGQLLKSADGPYAMTDLYIGLLKKGLGFEFYNSFIERIYAINSNELLKSAQKHLRWDEMTVITAG